MRMFTDSIGHDPQKIDEVRLWIGWLYRAAYESIEYQEGKEIERQELNKAFGKEDAKEFLKRATAFYEVVLKSNNPETAQPMF